MHAVLPDLSEFSLLSLSSKSQLTMRPVLLELRRVFVEKSLSAVEFSPLAANAFTKICRYNAQPRATCQRAERGFNGPKTLSEGKPSSQEWSSHKRALDWQVARRRDSVGRKHQPALQMG